MATWWLNKALTNFRDTVNARWPKRDKTSDGTIGDQAHAERVSDHNPDADGSVDAWDMDVDGVDVELLKQTFQAHESAGYWIHNRQIASRNDGWTRRTYSGPNTHEKHVHWNTRGAYENSSAPWIIPESEDDMDKLIQWKGGYWLCTARGRERIPDGATYTRYRGLSWVQAYPGKDANGFAAPALETQGWADWQVDDVFGPDTTIPRPVEVTLTPEQVAEVAEAARVGAEAGSPTDAELEAAAFEGAQRAEAQ